MRLTLRTMLAYLEDLLEPADAEEVQKKIEESEFATTLMHRTRDVTRRLRLGAPKLQGRGMGLDPNTVAEYLDYTLLSERVPDFEKICLESDVHLAEVASCHQILALVLSKPAEIEQGMRERMYGLLNQADATAAARTAAKSERTLRDKSERSSRRKKKRRRPKVPDYLREGEAEPKSRPWAVLALAALLLVAAGIGAFTFWPQISARLQPRQVARVEPPENTAAVNNPPAEAEKASDATAGKAAPEQEGTPPAAPEKPSTNGGTRTAQSSAARADEMEPEEPADRPEQRETSPAGVNEAVNKPDEKEKSADVGASARAANSERPSPPPERGAASDAAATTPRKNTETESPQAPAEEAPSSETIGRLISEEEVLLRSVDAGWQRVASRGTIRAGERLIALPTYRPNITMSNGVTLQLVGGAIAELGRADADGTPDIRLGSGRLLLLTVGKPGSKVRLQAGDYNGTVEFGSDEAALAVEVRPSLPEGADPEQEAAPSTVDFYLTSGEATWIDRKGKRDTLRGRAHRTPGGTKAGGQADELPLWIEESELNPTERRASEDVEKFVKADKPAVPALTELAKHRRIENSLLATQSLALIDHFDPIVPLLNDKAYRIAWTSQIEALRAALARGPETAAAVRKAFEAVHGKEAGGELYRMLWGYNSQQLEEGAAAQLIEWLDAPDDRLDFRVLSFWNLHHITGLGLYYQPGDPEKQRRTSIQRWKQKLESGLIVPKAA